MTTKKTKTEEPKKLLFIMKEVTEEADDLYGYSVYEELQQIEVEGEVLIYEFKSKGNLKIQNILEEDESKKPIRE